MARGDLQPNPSKISWQSVGVRGEAVLMLVRGARQCSRSRVAVWHLMNKIIWRTSLKTQYTCTARFRLLVFAIRVRVPFYSTSKRSILSQYRPGPGWYRYAPVRAGCNTTWTCRGPPARRPGLLWITAQPHSEGSTWWGGTVPGSTRPGPCESGTSCALDAACVSTL